jgi:hypothetical protein
VSDSISFEGINVYPLISRLLAYRDWKVCFRKLEWNRDRGCLEALDRFIDLARGSKFSLLGLLYNRSMWARDDIDVTHSRSDHQSTASRSTSGESNTFSSSCRSRPSTSESNAYIASTTVDDTSIRAASTFFCSELVATAYQALGLIAADKRAGSFLPFHFTEAGSSKLELSPNARLSPETAITYRKSGMSTLQPHVRRVHSFNLLQELIKST